MADRLIIYSDGGARGNPGPAAIGVAIYDIANTHEPIVTISKFLGHTTNNQAEYHALLAGLEQAHKLGAKELTCFLDSELVVKQLTGKYKVRESGLADLVGEILRLQNKFTRIDYRHVPREKNKLADRLVNEALDKNEST
jgi:ribonuclease HI